MQTACWPVCVWADAISISPTWLLGVAMKGCYTTKNLSSRAGPASNPPSLSSQVNVVTLITALMPRARERLIVISDMAPVVDAARLLSASSAGLVVVCNPEGQTAGVVTKADVVREISTCTGCSCTTRVSDIMTRDVKSCSPEQSLSEVWALMKQNALKQVPVVGNDRRPLGVLYVNDALETMLSEVENNEVFLRDYVMGLGYR